MTPQEFNLEALRAELRMHPELIAIDELELKRLRSIVDPADPARHAQEMAAVQEGLTALQARLRDVEKQLADTLFSAVRATAGDTPVHLH